MRKLLLLGLLLIGLMGCSQAPTQSPTIEAVSPTVENHNRVRAEGFVEPARAVLLRAEDTGVLAEIIVVEGTVVQAEDVLLRFDTTDVDLRVRQAEVALISAEARLALLKAGARPEETAIVEAQLRVTQAVIAQATAARQAHVGDAAAADIAAAQAQLARAESAYQQAADAHQETMTCYTVTQPDGSTSDFCPALGTLEEMARFQEQAAYAGVLAAQANLNAIRGLAGAEGSEKQAVEQTAIAQHAAMAAQLALLQAGSSAEAIATAEAGVLQAQAALETARAQRNRYVLRAPFSGTVTSVAARTGDAVAAGDALITLATLNALQVRTQDLTELDIPRLTIGQQVAITLDAHPTTVFRGRLAHIDQQSDLHLGDVVYPVVIAFEDTVPAWVRWRMTAQVEVLENAATFPTDTQTSAERDILIAQAVIEPAQWSAMSFAITGKVAEVLITPGEPVVVGQPLLRLDDTYAALAVREAQAALAVAQSELALRQALPQAEAIAVAEAQIAVEAGNLAAARARYQQVTAGGAQSEMAAALLQLESVQAERRQVAVQLQWAEDGEDTQRADDLRRQLGVLDREIVAAETRLSALPSANAAQIRAAQAGVAIVQAQYDVAQARLAAARAGYTAAEIAVAAAVVQQAEVALAMAEAALARTVVRAPFAGTVTQITAEVGDLVAPGQSVLVLATLDQWHAQTTDLQELFIRHIVADQSATVRIDALPNVTFSGVVTQIGLQGVEYRGDVTYPVVITFDGSGHTLYWGMTALVEMTAP